MSGRERDTFNCRMGRPVRLHLSDSQIERSHPEHHFVVRCKISVHDKYVLPVNPLNLTPLAHGIYNMFIGGVVLSLELLFGDLVENIDIH